MILKGIYINLTQNDALPVGGEGGGGGGGGGSVFKTRNGEMRIREMTKII